MLSPSTTIGNLKRGFRWCRGHGEPVIHPDEPEWKDMCSLCFANKVQPGFCGECGEKIEWQTMEWAKENKAEPKRCQDCRYGWRHPHPVHGVKLPDRFYLSLQSHKKAHRIVQEETKPPQAARKASGRSEAGFRGGIATKAKADADYYRRIGSKGGKAPRKNQDRPKP